MSVAARAATAFLVLHALALALGIFGLLSAVPDPAQFAGNPYAMAFYDWAIQNTGTVRHLDGDAGDARLRRGERRPAANRALLRRRDDDLGRGRN